jgi:hypothetical protein
MIPEKWDELYLYASIIEKKGNAKTGELFFYYIPKGIIKKKAINVYEIPARFNIDEDEYFKLVEMLYDSIKELREIFKKSDQALWSNITISIKNLKFRAEFNYDNLQTDEFSSFERHIIWRYKYLNTGLEQCNREERKILKRYLDGYYIESKSEVYNAGIYIKEVKNIVDYENSTYESTQNVEYVASKNVKNTQNQILFRK